MNRVREQIAATERHVSMVRFPEDCLMGLREILAKRLKAVREAVHRGPGPNASLAFQYTELRQELAQLRHLLEETCRTSKEKDELIAKLQAAGVVRRNMVSDGSAYYTEKDENILDGPFCTHCFDQNQEMVCLVPAPELQEAAGRASKWVRCPKCRTPVRSRRIAQHVNPQETAPTPASAPQEESKKSRASKVSGHSPRPRKRRQRRR